MKSSIIITLLGVVLFAAFGCHAAGPELMIEVGEKGYPAGPMSFKMEQEITPGNYMLVSEDKSVAAQIGADGVLWWWEDELKPGAKLSYRLANNTDPDVLTGKKGVQIKKINDGQIEVKINDKPFTVLNFKQDESKPYLYPVIGPTGAAVTRSFPMKNVDGERQDHHHHRSIWCAHGDIRVADRQSNYWHEPKEGNWDQQRVTKFTHLAGGAVFGRIIMEIDWIHSTGKRDFTEVRTYTFFAANDDVRMIDATNLFNFTDADVTFADTKEGGIMALRIATSMDEKEPGKGRMTNSKGGIGAGQCWGKAAEWCDYVGPVDGKTVGIAVFDHPRNYGYPAHWHIREYGLYTTNPFGLSQFQGKEHNGSKTWKKGETVEFRNRVYIHKDDTKKAGVQGQYDLYANPPKMDLVGE